MKTYGLFVINGMGNTTMTDISLYHGDLEIFYINYGLTEIQKFSDHILQIAKFKYYDNEIPKNITVPKRLLYTIMVEFWQEYYYNTEVCIKDSIFQSLRRIELMSIRFFYCSLGKHLVSINGCLFLNNSGVSQKNSGVITVMYPWCNDFDLQDAMLNTNSKKKVQIFYSKFINNTAYHKPAIVIRIYYFNLHYEVSHVTVSNCLFSMNGNFSVVDTPCLTLVDLYNKLSAYNCPGQSYVNIIFSELGYKHLLFCTITINDSVFIQTGSGKDRTVIHCYNAVLNFNGPLVFKNFKSKTDSIISVNSTNVTIHGHVEFFNNIAVSLLLQTEINSIQFKENLLLSIINNKFYEQIFSGYWTKMTYNYVIL